MGAEGQRGQKWKTEKKWGREEGEERGRKRWEMWLSVIVHHLLASMLTFVHVCETFVSMCVSVSRWWIMSLSAHSSRREQNNPPENYLTLHQGYRLASTARYFSLKVQDSQCLSHKTSCSNSTNAFFFSTNIFKQRFTFTLTLRSWDHESTICSGHISHMILTSCHCHSRLDVVCVCVCLCAWVCVCVNGYCNRHLSHWWFDQAIVTIIGQKDVRVITVNISNIYKYLC